MCVAAYVALATGVGISFSTAAQLRLWLIFSCCTALLLVAGRRAIRLLIWRKTNS
jgi:hypothetical protein